MDATASDLSGAKYGYDMVVGTTQASINATMKSFLDQYNGQEFIKCYIFEPGVNGAAGQFVEIDYEQLKTNVGGDPFSIPTGADATNAMLNKLYQQKFAFAFKATMGLTTDFPLTDVPDVVVLDKGNSMVSYNLTCKEFEVLDLQNLYGQLTWNNLKQSEQPKPWTFAFNVDLDLQSSDSAFQHLPQDVQTQVKNLCPNSMFSVQQLYLDLNTAGLESSPTITGLDTTSNAYIYLTRTFLGAYFKNMQDTSATPGNPDGSFLLGYTVKPSTAGNTSSITPTDLNFLVSPYLDDKGIATQDYSMYTLNWLVMTQEHSMPAAVPFEWNWVTEAQKSQFNGAMSIKKGTFSTFLNGLLSPSLKTVCLTPAVTMDANFISLSFTMKATLDSNPGTYSVVNDGTSRVLTFSYNKSSSDSATFVPNWGNITLKSTLQSDVYLEGNTIRAVTTATAFLHLNAEGGVSEGNIVSYTAETIYNVAVDAAGQLTVTMSPTNFTDNSHFDTSTWSQIISFGTIDAAVSTIKNYWECMKTYLSGEQNAILSMLNGSSSWVFPGGKTFVFKNAEFSQFQDFVTQVTYAEPTAINLATIPATAAVEVAKTQPVEEAVF
jgi:hypothetical protein